jgi:signal recognition particle receptor subunit beta
MVSINYASREVTCKIVYYGPGLSGKTTNLIYIHKKVPANTKGKMISLATEADRTLYFDFLPINIGTISGFAAKFQLYTVPGQVYYNATRKLVLRGVDGLVFVADSQADKMDENIESLNNLRENLQEYGYDINEIPVVIQYNKRDLPNILSVEELEAALNPNRWKFFEGAAVDGTGVFDTLKAIIKLVLDNARNTQSAGSRRKEHVSSGEASKAQMAAVGSDHQRSTIPPKPATAGSEVAAAVVAESEPARESVYQSPAQPGQGVTEPQETADTGVTDETGVEPVPGILHGNQLPSDEKQAAEEESEPSRMRPFPGSASRIARRERRITVSDFQPGTRTGRDEDMSAIPGRPGDEKQKIEAQMNESLPSPTMAPSNRLVKRKRGFFKRLFGIK